MKKTSDFSRIAFVICILAAAFYMYEFTLQVSLGVMTNELMQDLNLNAASLGLASAFYFYAYTPMQVPAGLLHDRFGPRRTLTFAIMICAIGALCFSFSTGVVHASLGRFMMGIGSAFSFSGALMLIARWFPPQHFAVLSGFVQLMSSVGAIGGEVPLAKAIHHWGWRPSMVFLAIFGAVLALVVWWVVRDFPNDKDERIAHPHPVETDMLAKMKALFGNKPAWWIAAYSFLIWAPIAAFAGLWGIPFLVSAYHMTTESASFACATIWIGIGIGSPLSGWISEQIERRCIVLATCAVMGIIASISVMYCTLSLPILYLCLFMMGLAGGGQSLAFCVVRDNSHPKSIGAAIGLNNMATVAGGAILQPIIGYLLYINWDGVMSGHTPVYNATDYRMGLLMIPMCYVLAAIVSLKCVKETYCKQKFPY
jgi:MFS family permease